MDLTQYTIQKPPSIFSLVPTKPLDLQKNLCTRMRELRHKVIRQGFKEEGYEALEEPLLIDKTLKVQKMVEAELIRRRKDQNTSKKEIDRKSDKANESHVFDQFSTKVLLKENRINKEKQDIYSKNHKLTLELPIVRKLPKIKISQQLITTNPKIAHLTIPVTELSYPMDESFRPVPSGRSNSCLPQPQSTYFERNKQTQRNTSRKKRRRQNKSLFQILDKTRQNFGPTILGTGLHKKAEYPYIRQSQSTTLH